MWHQLLLARVNAIAGAMPSERARQAGRSKLLLPPSASQPPTRFSLTDPKGFWQAKEKRSLLSFRVSLIGQRMDLELQGNSLITNTCVFPTLMSSVNYWLNFPTAPLGTHLLSAWVSSCPTEQSQLSTYIFFKEFTMNIMLGAVGL